MYHMKMRKISSYVCLLLLLSSILVPTLSAHIYAAGVQTEERTEVKETAAAEEIKIEETIVTEEAVLENGTIEMPADDLYVGETFVSNPGNTGLSKKTYSVRYENGVAVSKVLTNEEIITKPTDKIVFVGTKEKQIKTIAGTYATKPASYKRYIDVSASAYDLSYASCGKRPGDRGYGVTASGMRAQVGVVAVDPRVIPLGTKLYIEAPDGSWTYGSAVAGDTGGAIKGNRVDLFFNTYSECMQFGRRTARVYILD